MATAATALDTKMRRSPGRLGVLAFLVILAVGIGYAAIHLFSDLENVHATSIFPYLLLGVALLIALGFEFVNGFHDTANAVATVIYTHSLEPHVAVVWSGAWNLLGVLTSSGAVAFGIISLLPVELILQVGSNAGFAMVFALLVAAIIWNLGTWWLGLPSSSSHTLIGSVIGVGIANQLMAVKTGTSGVDWGQATNIGKSLLISPLVGFAMAALMLLLMKFAIRDKRLYQAPEGEAPPPFWIRGLLFLTCTGVSFFHGSNDGQKGMGLIMLILIGTVPTAYALNHAVTARQSQDFIAVTHQTVDTLNHYRDANAVMADSREDLTEYIRTRNFTPKHDAGSADADQRHRHRNGAVQSAEERAPRTHPQLPQRYVRGQRNAAADRQVQKARHHRRRLGGTEELQKPPRQGYPVHPLVGEGSRGAGPRAGHHGGLEAHCGYRGREDRQVPPDLRTGRRGGDHGNGHHRIGGRLWAAGQHDARFVVGRSGNHGRQPLRPAVGHGAQPVNGVGTDAPRIHRSFGAAFLDVPLDGNVGTELLAAQTAARGRVPCRLSFG
jgi:phosphate/sulfate permease